MRILAIVLIGLVVAALMAWAVSTGGPPVDSSADAAAGLLAGAAIYDLAAGLLAYFAPLWIALSRSHGDAPAIGLVNLVLGWTIIGWLLAMVWALSRLPPEPADAPRATLPG